MLDSLHIENIAVIERADIEFSAGFNVLTGETGAGKSILIDSINAVLGNRTSKELIRSGCERASVSAVFSTLGNDVRLKLTELGFDSDDNELCIQRVITENKSTVKINGINTTASILREIAPLLVNIHGQHDSQALLDPDKHYIYIDLLADNSELLDSYSAAFSAMMSTRRRLKTLTAAAEQNAHDLEILQYQVNELENANIEVGEIERLKNRQNELANARQIADNMNTAASFVADNGYDDTPSVLGLIDSALEQLSEVANVSDNIASLYGELDGVRETLADLNERIEQTAADSQYDPEEAQSVDERLDMYYRFSHKYGKTEQEMLDFLQNAKERLNNIEQSDDEIVSLNAVLKAQVDEVKQLGKNLTDSRKAAGERFANDVAAQLKYLDMPNVKIVVDITPCAYSKLGADKIEFMISTNPGEPPKSLSKIASGGEMSRIMLAIKSVLAGSDTVGTLIFDEIDSGISGRAAVKVGEKLKSTAKSRQVICVTHLAQIAAKADNHLLILKNTDTGRAVTSITQLDFDGRCSELARIIGGAVTQSALQTAREMLQNNNA